MTTDPSRVLAEAHHVLVHNWPSTDVPHTLARALVPGAEERP